MLDEPERTVDPNRDHPRLVELVERVRALPEQEQERLLDVWEGALRLLQE